MLYSVLVVAPLTVDQDCDAYASDCDIYTDPEYANSDAVTAALLADVAEVAALLAERLADAANPFADVA